VLIATELPSDTGEKTMTLAELHTQKGIQKGIQKGDHNARLSIAQNLLRKGLAPALVAETTGIDLQTIKEMAIQQTQHENIDG
jgi:predicted transposase/invertase (TIGR01784 family)